MREQAIFGLPPTDWIAGAAVVNALVVCILAGINYRYMKSAERQARAAEAQAAATQEQAATARQTLIALRAQIEEQRALSFSRTLNTLRAMKAEIEAWLSRLHIRMNDLPEEVYLVPPTWEAVLLDVERIAPQDYEEALKLRETLTKTTHKIRDIVAMSTSARSTYATQVLNDLTSASIVVGKLLQKMEEVATSERTRQSSG